MKVLFHCKEVARWHAGTRSGYPGRSAAESKLQRSERSPRGQAFHLAMLSKS